MKILLFFVLLACIACSQQEKTGTSTNLNVVDTPQNDFSRFRPIFHFSPPKNWVNDPNGLVYHQGTYHLFYQYNPYSSKWGHMTWAHATSKDFINWENLPIAIPENEQDSMMIFSGSVVVDTENSSGFGTKENPPLVAIYTAFNHSKDTLKSGQSQHLAYSNDGGTTWTKYEKNPIIDLKKKDFRDPNVFWHIESKQWVMAVVLPLEFKCLFYASKNLKTWNLLSEFAGAGDRRLIWECPALVELPVDGNAKQKKWALLISAAHPDSTSKYVGMQYFVGDFDGKIFKNLNKPSTTLWLEYGKDFYAAIPWNQNPDERKIIYGWMNNWAYADTIPTSPWRGQMSVPRTIGLKTYAEGIRLTQLPVKELEKLRKKAYHFDNLLISELGQVLKQIQSHTLEIEIEFEIQEAKEFGIKVAQGKAEETIVGYEVDSKQVYIDRRTSGMVNFKNNFASKDNAPLEAEDGKIKLKILLDNCSVEVFANDGRVAITSLIFPSKESKGLSLFAKNGKVKVVDLMIWELGK